MADRVWQRIERRDWYGRVVDYVEVAACAGCGRGVDREFDDHRIQAGELFCADCLDADAAVPSERVTERAGVKLS